MIKCGRGKTNPQKMQRKTATNTLWYGEFSCLLHCKHLYSWRRITRKIYIPSKIQERISLWNRWFDISEKLITEQSDEIYGVNTINWEDSSWNFLSLIGDEEVISLLHTKDYVFSDSVLCLGKMNENPQSNYAWEDRLTWFKRSPEYRALDKIDGEPMDFEWHIFPGFTTLQLCNKVQELLSKLSVTPEKSQDGLSSCRCSTTSHGDLKDNEKECESSAQLVSLYAKRFSAGQWSFLGPGSEKKWYSTHEYSPQTEWDRIAEQMMLTFAESKHQSSDPRVHDPEECSKQRRWKIVNTLLCRWRDGWNCSSHIYFRQSAQYLRSSLRDVRRM